MKDVLNFFGVFFSVIFTIVLSVLLFALVIVANTKTLVSKKGLNELINNIDIVEILKADTSQNGWNDIVDVGKELGLSEKQVEQVLSSKEIKNELSTVLSDVLDNAFKGEQYQITDDAAQQFIDTIFDECDKAGDVKLSKEDKEELSKFVKEDIISEINQGLSEMEFDDQIDADFSKYYDLAINVAFGSASLVIAGLIIGFTIIIALLRFSYYKWMPYFGVGSIFASILLTIVASLLRLLNVSEIGALGAPIIGTLSKNIYIGVAILIVLAIVSFVLHHILKKDYINKHQENEAV